MSNSPLIRSLFYGLNIHGFYVVIFVTNYLRGLVFSMAVFEYTLQCHVYDFVTTKVVITIAGDG